MINSHCGNLWNFRIINARDVGGIVIRTEWALRGNAKMEISLVSYIADRSYVAKNRSDLDVRFSHRGGGGVRSSGINLNYSAPSANDETRARK